MNYLLLFFLLLPNLCNAQLEGYGLGHFVIGKTTPDSLQQIDFKEDEQSYVKGTIALPCTHIRTFKSTMVAIDDVPVSNLSLAFYDNKLFKITCDYNPKLPYTFPLSYEQSIVKPVSRFSFCSKDKPMLLWGKVWKSEDGIRYVIHSKGYTASCEMQENAQLVIVSQRLSALASDCDLKSTNLLIEEFERGLNYPPK
jgi:hypothetical protein